MQGNRFDLVLSIGHDLDGNIYDWVQAVTRGFVDKLGYDEERFVEPVNYAVWEDWGFSILEFFREYDKLVREGLLAEPGYLIDGELDFLAVCAQRGHRNYIITARHGGPFTHAKIADTFRWVADHLHMAPVHGLHINNDKTSVTTDIFFDDHVDNIYALLDSPCLAPFLVDQPWNRHATDLDELRVYSPQDKLRVLMKVEDTIADAVGLEAKMDHAIEDELAEAKFWEMRNKEIAGEPPTPEYIEDEMMADKAQRIARSLNERLRYG
jgi:hypothetical protein